MKKYVFGALFGFLLAAAMLFYGANTMGAPLLTYVYSNSMEPLIKVNDAFLVWPATDFKVGDIIMYRPKILEAPFITHRIIAIGEYGYITKGDNSPYQDQESGEPEVTKDRITGRVVTVSGRPVIIPGIGKLSALFRSGSGRYTGYLSGLFFAIGILSVIVGNKTYSRKPKPRHRLRLRHLYKGITIGAVILVILSIYFGSRVSQIRYLVSEYPGDRGDQIAVNQPDNLVMSIKNNGWIPVWTVCSAIAPLQVKEVPKIIWARRTGIVTLEAEPHRKTGMYQGYVQVFNYPVLLPRSFTMFLHRLSPSLAILMVGLAFGCYMTVLFRILGHIHGFEGFIPLRAIKDKIFERRMRRAKAKILGRRKIR